MASTIINYRHPVVGMTLTFELRALNTASAAALNPGDSFTHSAIEPGFYTATVTEALSGVLAWRVLSGSSVIDAGVVDIANDAGPYYLNDQADQKATALQGAVSTLGAAAEAVNERVTGPQPLKLYVGESGSPIPVRLLNPDGTAADLTGLATPATFSVKTHDLATTLHTEVVTVTESPAAFNFSPDAAVTASATLPGKAHHYSLRDANGIVKAPGRLEVLPTA